MNRLPFALRRRELGYEWVVAPHATQLTPQENDHRHKVGDEVTVESRSLKVLRRVR